MTTALKFGLIGAAFRDPSVIGVEVEVRVNGVPIHEDALTTEQRPVDKAA